MNYSGIIYDDVANGPGIRTSLFVSGCRRHCKGCFNQEAQDFNYGNEFTTDIEYQIIKSMDKYHQGITILGGEPLEPENAFTLFLFCLPHFLHFVIFSPLKRFYNIFVLQSIC